MTQIQPQFSSLPLTRKKHTKSMPSLLVHHDEYTTSTTTISLASSLLPPPPPAAAASALLPLPLLPHAAAAAPSSSSTSSPAFPLLYRYPHQAHKALVMQHLFTNPRLRRRGSGGPYRNQWVKTWLNAGASNTSKSSADLHANKPLLIHAGEDCKKENGGGEEHLLFKLSDFHNLMEQNRGNGNSNSNHETVKLQPFGMNSSSLLSSLRPRKKQSSSSAVPASVLNQDGSSLQANVKESKPQSQLQGGERDINYERLAHQCHSWDQAFEEQTQQRALLHQMKEYVQQQLHDNSNNQSNKNNTNNNNNNNNRLPPLQHSKSSAQIASRQDRAHKMAHRKQSFDSLTLLVETTLTELKAMGDDNHDNTAHESHKVQVCLNLLDTLVHRLSKSEQLHQLSSEMLKKLSDSIFTKDMAGKENVPYFLKVKSLEEENLELVNSEFNLQTEVLELQKKIENVELIKEETEKTRNELVLAQKLCKEKEDMIRHLRASVYNNQQHIYLLEENLDNDVLKISQPPIA